MAIDDRAEATAKNIEGKAQEAWSEVTGDPKDKAEGKAKQVDAQAKHAKEDVKDSLKDRVDRA
ncbi:CsbD family protein [Desertifilum sp. FACHB-1129]|uniref:CsbD-like domain-containing protein n=2 Tax=Desertifilum tharense IPPAS B-1220 TaxID=1781255 RepID=A0A1E5QKJ8_9CYAN|nr:MULTISPECIES: CsbD family protein [Desertifilum]MCD8485403.1 CsbD family protein [Desertifilum sp.]MDA0209744.1 CsbD family protein [Cyanobacteria bacterium FC1]MDI9637060.1 CsbD family protein [Geitlerinema splendidum]MBD2310765.1 CsbD family protein [Desertifilum sp. FACHB-1129]MBD2320802.1 CsbD family protein [Desertifilum sp. FACHB-866]